MNKKGASGGQTALLIMLLIAFIITGFLGLFNMIPMFNLSMNFPQGTGFASIIMTIFARFVVMPLMIVACGWVMYHLIKGR